MDRRDSALKINANASYYLSMMLFVSHIQVGADQHDGSHPVIQ